MKKDKKDKQEKKVKKGKKKRSLLGRIIIFLLTVLAIIGLIAMALCVISSYVNPVKFVWGAYFGLAFWIIFLYNLVILTLLLLMWSNKAWVAVLALLVAIPGVYKSFCVGKPQGGGDLRIMSYNVLHFKDFSDPNRSAAEVAEKMVDMVLENHPDVLCIQEFQQFKTNRRDCIANLGEQMKMPYQYYHTKQHFGGNVIFSKYPLKALDPDDPMGEEKEYGPVVQVDAGEKGLFYVICVHLTSFQLTNDEITVFSDKENTKEEVKSYSKSIVVKLKTAYEKRSEEVSKMLEDIPHDGSAIVLCGDFNDTPLSYTYHQIKRAGFVDGFVKAGWGIGRTYAGKLPMLRIDYIWGNEQIQPMIFKRLKVKVSDHYPVMMDFNVSHGF